jgi:hypothetical protein
MKKPTIEFTVEPKQYKEIKEYAKEKWHGTPAGLARFALGQYMSRYPIKRKGCTAHLTEGNLKDA